MVSSMMWSFSVAYAAQQTIGQLLDSTKAWVPSEVPWQCNCHMYPKEWPRRHGHIFIPSWEYQGAFEQTVHCLASCVVSDTYQPWALRAALKHWWNRYLPAGLLGEFQVPPRAEHSPSSSSPLSRTVVKALVHYLRKLVVMGIDKCKQRKLILCPALYDKYYRQTFPVQSDSDHFHPISMSVNKYSKWIRNEFNRRKWYQIATFHSGSPPVPYPLFKLRIS